MKNNLHHFLQLLQIKQTPLRCHRLWSVDQILLEYKLEASLETDQFMVMTKTTIKGAKM